MIMRRRRPRMIMMAEKSDRGGEMMAKAWAPSLMRRTAFPPSRSLRPRSRETHLGRF